MLKNNCDDVADDVRRFAERLKQTIVDGAGAALDIIAVRAQGNMIYPGGMGEPVDPRRLTTRMGRLMRSLAPGGGAFHNETSREGIRAVTVKDKMVVITFGSSVPYLAPHEFGGTMPARTMDVTERMRGFFWAKLYETGDEKFKAMALSQTINIPAYNMPARPVITPAVKDSIPDIEKMMRGKLEALAIE